MALRSLHMLLIEDSPSDARLVKEALNENTIPYEMVVARDGVEGMEYLHRVEVGAVARPDIVLLDLNLPRKNGLEVLAEIKSSPTLKHIPVLVMTSSRSNDDIYGAYSLNANCFISKPGNLNDYISVVRAIEDFWFCTATLPEGNEGPGTKLMAYRAVAS